jgi:hypothetical protein
MRYKITFEDEMGKNMRYRTGVHRLVVAIHLHSEILLNVVRSVEQTNISPSKKRAKDIAVWLS